VVEMSEEDAKRLESDMPDVVVLRDRPLPLIEPVRSVRASRSPSSADLWHLRAIALETARGRGFSGTGSGVNVAVLDTGIDETHPEIDGRVASAVTFDVERWRASPQRGSRDTDGHGTHVAGLIAGKRVGVAPGAKLLNGIMIPNGRGMLSDFVLALEWAAGEPEVRIVNMSAGIPGFIEGMSAAISDLFAVGVLPVIATGNEGRNRTRSPGNYDSVLSVGATNSANQVARFSSGGSIVVGNHQYHVPDLVAPGEGVFSCVMGGGYEAWDGTSMATPIVSGLACLVAERWPDISPLDLVEELIQACRSLGEPPERQGAGLVQVPPRLVSKAKPRARRRRKSSKRSRARRRRP
jgi:subtilisin family serine protease